MSALLFDAFRALGSGPTRREVAQVAAALRESGDEGVGRLLDDPHQRVAIADDAGAYGFVALDLAVAFHSPGAFAELVDDEPVR